MGPPGHIAIGFVAKPTAIKAPLWLLLVASLALDILSFVFEALGLEDFGTSRTDFQNGLTVIIPGTVPWILYVHYLVHPVCNCRLLNLQRSPNERRPRDGGFSPLDIRFHCPHWGVTAIFYGSLTVGLGLWTSGIGLILSIVLELALLVGGIVIYLIARRRNAILW